MADFERMLLPGGASLAGSSTRAQLRARRLDWDVNLCPEADGSAAHCGSGGHGASRPARRARLVSAAGWRTDASSTCCSSRADMRRVAPRTSDQEDTRTWPISAASRCSANSTRSATAPSRARPCSARCAAIRTSSWCTGCTRSCSSRTRTCTASSSTSASTPSRLARDLTEALDACRAARPRSPIFRSHIEEAVERGWVYGTLMFGESQVRTGHLIVGMLKTPTLRNALHRHLARVRARSSPTTLADDFASIVARLAGRRADGQRRLPAGGGAAPGEASGAMAPAAMGKQEALQALHGRPDRAGAQGRDRSDRRAATRRSARSSTS